MQFGSNGLGEYGRKWEKLGELFLELFVSLFQALLGG
jgi:hypothetical protein